MKRKIEVIYIVMMMCFSTIMLIPDNSEVRADFGEEEDTGIDTQLIYQITENLSNVIYDAYEAGELKKGRSFGSKGEHAAADYIVSLLTIFK